MLGEQILDEALTLDADTLICCRYCAREKVAGLPVTGVSVSGGTVVDGDYGTIREVLVED